MMRANFLGTFPPVTVSADGRCRVCPHGNFNFSVALLLFHVQPLISGPPGYPGQTGPPGPPGENGEVGNGGNDGWFTYLLNYFDFVCHLFVRFVNCTIIQVSPVSLVIQVHQVPLENLPAPVNLAR
jgi:hypothetical protein